MKKIPGLFILAILICIVSVMPAVAELHDNTGVHSATSHFTAGVMQLRCWHPIHIHHHCWTGYDPHGECNTGTDNHVDLGKFVESTTPYDLSAEGKAIGFELDGEHTQRVQIRADGSRVTFNSQGYATVVGDHSTLKVKKEWTNDDEYEIHDHDNDHSYLIIRAMELTAQSPGSDDYEFTISVQYCQY